MKDILYSKEQLMRANMKLMEQNKRYREAIERAIDRLTWNSVESEEILLKALDGDLDERN